MINRGMFKKTAAVSNALGRRNLVVEKAARKAIKDGYTVLIAYAEVDGDSTSATNVPVGTVISSVRTESQLENIILNAGSAVQYLVVTDAGQTVPVESLYEPEQPPAHYAARSYGDAGAIVDRTLLFNRR